MSSAPRVGQETDCSFRFGVVTAQARLGDERITKARQAEQR
jgi:hypothetical protein